MITLFCLIAYTDCFSSFYIESLFDTSQRLTSGPQRSYLLFDLLKDDAYYKTKQTSKDNITPLGNCDLILKVWTSLELRFNGLSK